MSHRIKCSRRPGMLDLIIERSPGNFQGSGVEAGAAVTEVIARLAAPLPAVGTKTQRAKQKEKMKLPSEGSI